MTDNHGIHESDGYTGTGGEGEVKGDDVGIRDSGDIRKPGGVRNFAESDANSGGGRQASGFWGFCGVVRNTVVHFLQDDAPMMGAALAYYALFSIAPLLMVAVAIAGIIFGQEAAEGELLHHLQGYFGQSAAQSIQGLLSAVGHSRGSGGLAVAIGIGVLLFGASSVFNQLKASLNRIWKVTEPKHSGIKGLVINRLLAIVMVLGVGILLLGSIIISAVINTLTQFASEEILPLPAVMMGWLDIGVMLALLWVMFAIIFRYLPDVRIGWRSVMLGAGVTAGLFLLGRYGISIYIAKGGLATGYGAASSVLVLLLWIYYSAQIFLFGAEFTWVYSRAKRLPVEEKCDVPVG